MKTMISRYLEDTEKIAHDWLSDISAKYSDLNEALVVGLSGHLGAGKTAFVKAVAQELGVTDIVTSPTFVIMKVDELPARSYLPTQNKTWRRLVHIDAYRLQRREELGAIDFESIVADENNLVMIEWPENVGLGEFREGCCLKFEVREGKYVIGVI